MGRFSALHLALEVALFDVIALVVKLFGFAEGDFDFGEAALVEIDFGGNKRQTFLGHLPDDFADFSFMQKKFTGPVGFGLV